MTPAPTRDGQYGPGRLSKPIGSYDQLLHTDHLTLEPLQKRSIEELDTTWLRAKPAQGSPLRRGVMLIVICATDGQTRGTPSPRLSAVATTSASTTRMYSTRAAALSHTVEQAWRAAVPSDSQELVTRSSAAMLSDICATDGQTRGTPSPRFSAVATTSTSTASMCSTRAVLLRSRNKRGEQQFRRTAKRSLLVGRWPC